MNFRPIPGWPYSVSPAGHIRNDRSGHILRPGHDAYGYKKVKLRDAGRLWQVHVHKLVALAFLGPAPSARHRVHLKDGMKHHPHLDNLEWRIPAIKLHTRKRKGRRTPPPKRIPRAAFQHMPRARALAAHATMLARMKHFQHPDYQKLNRMHPQ